MSATMTAEVRRLARFDLVTADADALAGFYERALGCRRLARGPAPDGRRLTLGLGRERIQLTQFDRPGPPYPRDASASDLIFQHFAIVVSDMTAAYGRLIATAGWSTISRGGPQRLPESSGGVTAFKFRDPEGHPLELLAFPAGDTPARWRKASADGFCQGIDHSAISVADSQRSVAFYEGLGLRVSARSQNQGPEQARLDGLPDPHVEVTALTPRQPAPHLELLCYRSRAPGVRVATRDNDVAATRLVFEGTRPPRGERRLRDPDRHRLAIA